MIYCTIQEGAKLAGISRPTIYMWLAQGRLTRYANMGRPALKISEVLKAAQKNGKPARKK